MSRATLSYSFLQGAEWAIDSCLYGYSSVFLLTCGISNTLIGILLGTSLVLSFFGQIYLGELFNNYGQKSIAYFFYSGVFFLLASNLLLLLNISKWLSIVLFLICCLFIQLFPAFMNSAAMFEIQHGVPLNYGVGRGSGSIGYAVCSAMIGHFLAQYGTSVIFMFGFILSFLFLCGINCFFKTTKQYRSTDPKKAASVPSSSKNSITLSFLFKYKYFCIILLGIVLLMTGHTYMSNYLYQIVSFRGGNEASAGIASAIAACCEVPALFLFNKICQKLPGSSWLKLSCLILTVKMFLAFFSQNLFLLQLSEFLQLGFGLFTVSSVYYTGQIIPESDTINGQAYLNAASTLGVFLSLLSGGIIIDRMGISALLLIGSIILSIGSIIIFLSAKPAHKLINKSPSSISIENGRV